MARRSDHSREELHDLLLGQAQRIVETEGFRALTARRLAEAVGYSPGTLYNLFANLDDLVVHVNGRTLELLDASLAQTPLTGDPEKDILALAMTYFAFVAGHPRLWELLFEYRLGEGSQLPDWFTEKIRQILARLAAVLAPLFAPSESEIVDEAVQVLWASLHGIGSLATSGKLEVVATRSMLDLTRSLVVHYVGGLKAARQGHGG
jgi:AcrR family transcriptional regulator